MKNKDKILFTTFLVVFVLMTSGCFTMRRESPVFQDPEESEQSLGEGMRVASVVISNDVLSSMLNLAGVNASTQTNQTYFAKQDSLSSDGGSSGVSAPMWMSMISVGAEVCRDLVNTEKALPAANRRIFGMVNFAQGPAQLKGAVLDDIVARLARSFWARKQTDEEKTLISAAVASAINGQTNPNQTDFASILTCTAMMSSVSAVEL